MKHFPGRRAALVAVLSLVAPLVLAPSLADAQVQATPKNSRAYIERICNAVMDAQPDLVDWIDEQHKTVAEVCGCTRDGMWERFPSIRYWAYSTSPYEENQIKEAFPEVIIACMKE